MGNKKRNVVFLLAALLLAMAIGWFWQNGRGDASGVVLYGNVDVRELALAFRQSGRLQSMAVDEGATVKAGDVLAELDAQPLRNAVAQADAQVLQAEAALLKLRAGSRKQDIQRARAAVRQASANARKAAADFSRTAALVKTRAISQQDHDLARAAHEDAQAGLAAAREALSLQIEGARKEDIAAGEAALAAAQAARAQAQTALADARLVTPSDAVVLARVVEPGSMVSPQQPVYTLSLRAPVYVRAYASAGQLGRIAVGTPVRMSTDTAGKVYTGHVGFISPRAEFTPKAVETASLRTDLVYRLRIVVTSDDAGLNQGAPVTIEVLEKSAAPNAAPAKAAP
ncbi:MAG: secretion protein HlyD [Burkholderiaceae bacterium]|jgi:HlyD family secretion protein|nr:secretion protein HlyD [Burkholderiaceae bacterium]